VDNHEILNQRQIDSYWIGETKPCLTYGLRGLAAFSVSVQCCEQDLHSGVMGGSVHEVSIVHSV
jgi:hypothetical protein